MNAPIQGRTPKATPLMQTEGLLPEALPPALKGPGSASSLAMTMAD